MSVRFSQMIGRIALLGAVTLGVSACSYFQFGEDEEPVPGLATTRQNASGLAGMAAAATPAAQQAVNAFLWRASLDTLNFMPITQADPFGGVILTDWFSPPGTPNERFKVNLLILDAALRADGVRATVFRQALDPQGTWRDAPVALETASQIEDSILTRARQLRLAAMPAN